MLPSHSPYPAFRFLTRLPVPAAPRGYDSLEEVAQSSGWFATVGAVIGGILVIPSAFAGSDSLSVLGAAAVSLIAWVLVTGGLHLDGLADCADGLIAPVPPDRRQAIMHEPHTGSFAVIALGLVLIGKFAGLALLFNGDGALLVVAIPAIARCLPILLARDSLSAGSTMGRSFAQALPEGVGRLNLGHAGILTLAVGIVAVGLHYALLCLALLMISALIVKNLWYSQGQEKIGGVSGDIFGATIETSETVMLLVAGLLA